MAAGDILLCQFDQSIDGDNVQNVFYYVVDTDDSSKDNEDALAEQFEIDVIPTWQTVVTPDLSLDCLGTQKVFPQPKTAFRERFLTALGTAAGEALPIVVSALLQKFEPSTSGRGKKGHTYISGISEGNVAKGRIDSPLNLLLANLAVKLTADLFTPNAGVYKPAWAVFSAVAPKVITGFVDWTRSVVLPRVSHQAKRKTPIRKTS